MNLNPLGQHSDLPKSYCPEVLFKIPRAKYRAQIVADGKSSADTGCDLWNCYEFSWLCPQGVPWNAVLQITIPATSESIIESKSLKLYLGSFSQERFETHQTVLNVIRADLIMMVNSEDLRLRLLDQGKWNNLQVAKPPGVCIDEKVLTCSKYEYASELLLVGRNTQASETETTVVHSDLFRSLCPVTGQPDWATVIIGYRGGRWDYNTLGQYLVSFRNHGGFHEHCCETIFQDLRRYCQPAELCVECRFTRRGGIDINPIRTTSPKFYPWNLEQSRLGRQ